MRKMFLLNDRHHYNDGHKEIEVYLLSDLKKHPNLNKREYNNLVSIFKSHNKLHKDNPIIGFMKDIEYTDENPVFIQIYKREVEKL